MDKTRAFQVAGALAALGSLLVLLLVSTQLGGVERQLIVQGQQIRSLGEATDRLSARLKGLRASAKGPSTVPADPGCELPKLLHPEAPNLLLPRQTHWPSAGASSAGTLRRDWAWGNPKGFNTLTESAAEVGIRIENYVHSTAAAARRWTDPGTLRADLACRIEATDDHKEYTIYLRKGVKWHPASLVDLSDDKYAWLRGEHYLTAHDFVFTLNLMMNPQVENGSLKNYYIDLESWKALDDHTLVLKWKRSVYNSLSWSTESLFPLPEFLFAYDESGRRFDKETLGTRFNQHWYFAKGTIGTGPYMMTEYTPGGRIVLKRFEDYYGEKPAISEIVYSVYSDPDQTLLKLRAGELDSGELRPNHYRQELFRWKDVPADKQPKNSPFLNGSLQCLPYDRPSYRYIGWNTLNPLFADASVRRAMTHALNRKELIDKVFVGLGKIATGPFLPATGNLDPAIKPIPFDLKAAAKLLDAAGWRDTDGDGLRDKVIDGKRKAFEFSLMTYGSRPEFIAMANIYKEDLLKIGVMLNVSPVEWSLMLKRMDEKRFDAYTGGWSLPWSTDPYQTWHSSQALIPKGSNRVGFNNPEADKIIEQLRTTFDPAARQGKFRRLHRLIHDSQVYTFLLTEKTVNCFSEAVSDVKYAKARPMADSFPWTVRPEN